VVDKLPPEVNNCKLNVFRGYLYNNHFSKYNKYKQVNNHNILGVWRLLIGRLIPLPNRATSQPLLLMRSVLSGSRLKRTAPPLPTQQCRETLSNRILLHLN
jgi:hypothetical protein